MAPLSDTSDPVVREIRRLRSQVRAFEFATVGLFVLLIVAVGLSLWLRSADVTRDSRRQAESQVRQCFRNANQRPALGDISKDLSLSLSVRGFIRTIYENTPSVPECVALADRLDVPQPPSEG